MWLIAVDAGLKVVTCYNGNTMQVDIQKKPKTFVVINPVAGTSQAGTVREIIQEALQAREIPFDVHETVEDEVLRERVREAVRQGFELFISAGGDGTLSGVIGGLAGTQIPLVILPTGTWNMVARVLDIPRQVEQALDVLFQEHVIRVVDAMQVDQEFFVLSVSIGVGSRTIEAVGRREKRRFGKLADLWNGLNQLLEFRSHVFEVRIDGKPAKFRASEMMVANIASFGVKEMQLHPDIRMDDGRLNVCRIYVNTLGKFFKLAFSMLSGAQKYDWNVLCVDAMEEVEINSRKKLPVQGDGDLIGHLPVTVKLCPKAVHIVTPIPPRE